jgi:hypothetical protein
MFEVTCRHCGALVMVVASIGDAELRALREHVVATHPGKPPTDPTDAGDILAHFTLRRR